MGSDKWTIVQDEKTKVPYAYKGNQWVGYDDIASVNLKARYVKEQNLGGAMIWSIETDDFRGKCGQGKFPLLVSIRKGLNGETVENPPEGSVSSTTSTTTSTSTPSLSTSTQSPSSSTSTPSTSQATSSATSSSPTSTSTSPGQSTTKNPDEFVCKSEGFFKGKDCASFYR